MPTATPREYDPRYDFDRRDLATAILETLSNADFVEEYHEGDAVDPTKERTFYRPITLEGVDNIRVVVYTSIVGEEVREVGKDAIRVAAVYFSERLGRDRGVISETRIHRVGTIEAICERLLERMRSVWKKGARPNRCPECNAPVFKSKKGNEVCADLCWKTTEQLQQDAIRQSRRRSYRRWR